MKRLLLLIAFLPSIVLAEQWDHGRIHSATIDGDANISLKFRFMTSESGNAWSYPTTRIHVRLRAKYNIGKHYADSQDTDYGDVFGGFVSCNVNLIPSSINRTSSTVVGDSTDQLYELQLDAEDISWVCSDDIQVIKASLTPFWANSRNRFNGTMGSTRYFNIDCVEFTPGENITFTASCQNFPGLGDFIRFETHQKSHYTLYGEYWDTTSSAWEDMLVQGVNYYGPNYPCAFVATDTDMDFATLTTDGRTRFTFVDEDGNSSGPYDGPDISGLCGIP